jgi:hypothetical protein
MRAAKAAIFWNNKNKNIKVAVLGENVPYSEYPLSGGACWRQWQIDCDKSIEKASKICLKEMKRIIKEYKIDKNVAEEAFMEIDEFKIYYGNKK